MFERWDSHQHMCRRTCAQLPQGQGPAWLQQLDAPASQETIDFEAVDANTCWEVLRTCWNHVAGESCFDHSIDL